MDRPLDKTAFCCCCCCCFLAAVFVCLFFGVGGVCVFFCWGGGGGGIIISTIVCLNVVTMREHANAIFLDASNICYRNMQILNWTGEPHGPSLRNIRETKYS